MVLSQASIHAPQLMHSYCKPSRISIPVGQTCTQRSQSIQSPKPSALGSALRERGPRCSPRATS
ncbi:Uncharacterised protein [Vibrio cholerae]|nr:Uncharacterised protein [Vibrio cholerae]